MSRIVWLASYPKAGNTWLRTVLANLIRDSDTPASINELNETPLAAARGLIDDLAGPELSELTSDEIEDLRPLAYEALAREARNTLFLKIHDALTTSARGRPLVSEESTKGVVYIVRNPLDVAVSFAHHLGAGVDRAIAHMGNPRYGFVVRNDRGIPQLPQRLGTWSDHVISWVDSGLPIQVIRYEDMLNRPLETFREFAAFADLPTDEDRLVKAIEFSRFEILKRQEQDAGFREKSPRAESFFRAGRKESWRERLTAEQVTRIVSDHGRVMQRFGYGTENLAVAPIEANSQSPGVG